MPEMFSLSVPTSLGKFVARYSSKGLAELNFPSRRDSEESPAEKPSTKILAWHRDTTSALHAVLSGRSPEKLPPLDFSRGTNFQREVWRALQTIPPGETRTYGEIARQIGKPGAVRAVGGACGANPIPVLVPCHRVLAANKKIGGFSGGLEWKRKLLQLECVNLLELSG